MTNVMEPRTEAEATADRKKQTKVLKICYDDTEVWVNFETFTVHEKEKVMFQIMPFGKANTNLKIRVTTKDTQGAWLTCDGDFSSKPGGIVSKDKAPTLGIGEAVNYYKYAVTVGMLPTLDPHVKVVP